MKLCITTALPLILSIFVAILKSEMPNQDKQIHVDNPGADLRMEGVVKEIKACVNKDYLAVRINVDLSIAYTNIGRYPLLLHKEQSKTIGYFYIASSPENLGIRKFEHEQHFYIMSSGPEPDISQFVRIRSKQTYKVDATTLIVLATEFPDQMRILDGKAHYLQVGMWNEDDPLHVGDKLQQIRSRWLTTGYLWGAGSKSLAIPINLPQAKKIRDCR
jgi:hypothetical protein